MGAPDAKQRSGMRFRVLNLFWAKGTEEADLKPLSVLVWLNLWSHERDGLVSIATRQIADECRISHRSVINALAELRAKRMLKVKTDGQGTRNASTYVLSPMPNVKPAKSP